MKKTPVLFLLLLLCASSCDKSKPQSGTLLESRSPVHSAPAGNDAGQVRILPEQPSALTDLEVMVTANRDTVYQWEVNGRAILGEESTRLLKKHYSKGDRITFTARSGSGGQSASVQIGNAPPEVKDVVVTPQYMIKGVDITASPVGFDADGDHINFFYRWYINGLEAGDHSEVLKGNLFKKGDKIVLVVVPSDGVDDGEAFTSVPLVIANAPPQFTSQPAPVKSKVYEYNAQAADPDGDTVRYSLVAGPADMAIDEQSGKVTWQIKKEHAGDQTVEIRAEDAGGLKVIQKFTLPIAFREDEL